VEVEDGEEFVFDLVETVVNGVLSVIHEKHMDTNLVPFSVDWAENIMESLIDWQFLTHDMGEDKSEAANWLPDQEAAHVPLDSWGRGSVPSRIVEEAAERESAADLEHGKNIDLDIPQHESSGEENSEREDLESIKRSPDLHKLNQLRETLKYYKIKSDDLVTLRKIDKPSDTLHLLYQALGVIQDQPDTSYEYSVSVANLDNTKHFIETFGPRPIPEATLSLLQPYMENIILHPDHVKQLASPAALGLCTWLHSAYTFQTLCNVLNVETSIDIRTLRGCVIELKSLAKPPVHVKSVMCAVMALLYGKFTKDYAKVQAGFADPNILEKMETFDCTKLSQKFIQKFKKEYMGHTTAEMKAVSVASSYLYQWCEDQIYGSGSVIVRPPEAPKQKKVRRRIKVIKHPPPEDTADQYPVADSCAGSMDNMMPHQSTAIVKAQQGRPPGKKEVQYDEKGNVISVLKIKKLPTNRVKTTYEILDSSLPNKKNKLKPLKGVPSTRRAGSASYLYETQDHTPVPPSFVDAVTASPGVVIKQGSKIKRGPESVVLGPIDQNNLARFQNLLSSSS